MLPIFTLVTPEWNPPGISSLFYFAVRTVRLEAEIYNIKGISQSRRRIANISTKAAISTVRYSCGCIRTCILGTTHISARVSFSRSHMCVCIIPAWIMIHRTRQGVPTRDGSYIQPYRFAKRRKTIVLLLRKNSPFHGVYLCVPFNIKVPCKCTLHFKRCLAILRNCVANTFAIFKRLEINILKTSEF